MRYGHSVNSDIPEDPAEAEFPNEPWPKDVVIRIKLHPGVSVPAAPFTTGGSGSSAPAPQLKWIGPALGSVPMIGDAAAGLVGYSSSNSTRVVEGQEEFPPDEGLQLFRGLTEKDHLIHVMLSWTTLESYPVRVGVSLPVPNPVLEDGEVVFHEAQLWEETEEEWSDHQVAYVYAWLSQRFTLRSSTKMLPMGMPDSVDAMSVRTWKDGEFGYILFTPEDSLAEALKQMEVPVRIEYDDGFMKVGMSNAYTIRMLYEEFRSLTHETWECGPSLPICREVDSTVVHGASWEWSELRALINADQEVQHPPKIVEERGRGTLIRSLKSQGKLLQYWARSESDMEVGMFLPAAVNGQPWNVEYWMHLSIQLMPDAPPESYVSVVRERALGMIAEFSGATAQW
jgi:hypothetical protein